MNNEGMSISITRKDGTKDVGTEFAVVAIPFIDMVFKLRREIWLDAGDQLHISFNIPVMSREGLQGFPLEETHRYTEDWEYMCPVAEEYQIITYFRFTKIGNDAWIELLEEAPSKAELYTPNMTKAVKIR